jgi:hypothetical protein
MAKHAIIKAFYSSQSWTTLRLNLINERGNRCERCKEIIPRSRDIIGHHIEEITPETVNDYTISLNPDNIEIICFDCHNKEHKRFGYENERRVFLVYGPPMSGKAAYVKENMSRGDLVVDMDQLYSAVSYLPYYDKPDNLFANVIGIHNHLIDMIMTRLGKWNDAWIIGGYADKYKRNRIVKELGAELIFFDVSKDECIRRLALDEDRKFRQTEWKEYINKWFSSYTP